MQTQGQWQEQVLDPADRPQAVARRGHLRALGRMVVVIAALVASALTMVPIMAAPHAPRRVDDVAPSHVAPSPIATAHQHVTATVESTRRTHGPTVRVVDVVHHSSAPTAVVRPASSSPSANAHVDGSTPAAPVVPSVRLSLGANIAPSPDFLTAGTPTVTNDVATYANPCLTAQGTWPVLATTDACTNYVLDAIDNARAQEGVGPMVLPSTWSTLSTVQQLFVVADLERTARGLAPYVGINPSLSADAARAAMADSDPSLAPDFPVGTDAVGEPGFGGAWSSGYSVLVADYFWMYADGWGGSTSNTPNTACTSPGASGCWAHRDELLGADPSYNPGVGLGCTTCVMGTGYAVVNGASSFADLIELPKGAVDLTFTWAGDVQPYL